MVSSRFATSGESPAAAGSASICCRAASHSRRSWAGAACAERVLGTIDPFFFGHTRSPERNVAASGKSGTDFFSGVCGRCCRYAGAECQWRGAEPDQEPAAVRTHVAISPSIAIVTNSKGTRAAAAGPSTVKPHHSPGNGSHHDNAGRSRERARYDRIASAPWTGVATASCRWCRARNPSKRRTRGTQHVQSRRCSRHRRSQRHRRGHGPPARRRRLQHRHRRCERQERRSCRQVHRRCAPVSMPATFPTPKPSTPWR